MLALTYMSGVRNVFSKQKIGIVRCCHKEMKSLNGPVDYNTLLYCVVLSIFLV